MLSNNVVYFSDSTPINLRNCHIQIQSREGVSSLFLHTIDKARNDIGKPFARLVQDHLGSVVTFSEFVIKLTATRQTHIPRILPVSLQAHKQFIQPFDEARVLYVEMCLQCSDPCGRKGLFTEQAERRSSVPVQPEPVTCPLCQLRIVLEGL